MTFEFLCAGLNFETSDLVTFWLSGGQLLRPSGLVKTEIEKEQFWEKRAKEQESFLIPGTGLKGRLV